MVVAPTSAHLQADGEGNLGIHGAATLNLGTDYCQASSLDLSLVRLVSGAPATNAGDNSHQGLTRAKPGFLIASSALGGSPRAYQIAPQPTQRLKTRPFFVRFSSFVRQLLAGQSLP